ncbi:EAL domain-containing protein [Sporosarcina sp. ANT_H38]|uniref:EAL domain-containing protein n=1 Tax=Sporosarcina sp. ANT_H38 TaxID=2597358 RepID=UPI0011F10893|nr:EAL domain-containing protein [Sporosarcina sp. ANT_H38]KAA0965179.1 EAL domain-containing protein [Sporosarcina sp. ANT_H38]
MMLLEINNLLPISSVLEEKFSISILDRNGIFTHVNRKFCDLSKYSENELIGESYEKVCMEWTLETANQGMIRDLIKGKVSHQIVKLVSKDGLPYWVQATILPVLNEDRKITQFISFDFDITQKVLTEKKYKNTLEDFRTIENALNQSSIVAITNSRGIITYVNEKFCELSKYSADELIGKSHRVVNSGYHPKSFFKEMWRTIERGGIWKGDVKNRAKDGVEYWVNTTIVPYLDDKGDPYQYIVIRTDITDRKEAEEALQIALKNDFSQTVRNLQNAVFKYRNDDNGEIVFTLIEGKLTEKLGITTENISKKALAYPFSEEEIKQFNFFLKEGLQGKEIHFELNLFQYAFIVYISPIFENNEVIEVVGTVSDISERKEAEKLVEHMAYYDYLTALPNRRFFQQKVNETIKQSQVEDATFGIMFIDLDCFKQVNDKMGHAIGDQLLITVGERLKNCSPKVDIVARHGGDEFVILLHSAQPSELEAVATKIIGELSQPFVFGELDVFTSSSIGISRFPEDGYDYDTLIRNADSAMYSAKENGKNTYCLFDKEVKNNICDHKTLVLGLQEALQKDQFVLHYQPQMNLKTGKLIGVEALIRWQHPSEGIISPLHFIPTAEETGLIVQIGKWVLETACAQAKEWQNDSYSPVRMNVNVSFLQFIHPSFVAQVSETLTKTGLKPEYLNLEITESATIDVNHSQVILQQLREMGINISIDDFGTGYSSLSYLNKFPITHLKIDQVFVQELNTSTSNRAIVKTIVDLAKSLDLNIIAEGVETVEQELFLQELHCDEVQGYFYSKPLPNDKVQLLLKKLSIPSTSGAGFDRGNLYN